WHIVWSSDASRLLLPPSPTRRSSDLLQPSGYEPDELPDCSTPRRRCGILTAPRIIHTPPGAVNCPPLRGLSQALWGTKPVRGVRSEEHTSELQSRENLVCRLLLEKQN